MNRSMERFFVPAAVLVLCSMPPVSASAQSADFKVTPVAVNEARYNVLIPTKRKSYYNNSLTVILRFEGEGVKKATRYGKLKLTSAKDDTGAEVKLSRSFGFSTRRLQNLGRNRFNVVGQRSPANEFEIPIRLELPGRSAKALKSLKGTVTFAVGKTETVTIPVSKLEDLSGKDVKNPLLTKMGLTLHLDKYTKTSGNRARFKITGDKRDAVLSANFIDPAGKSLSFGSYVLRASNYTSANVSSSKAPPEGSTVQIVIETERKDTVVPFDLKDVPLK